MSQSRSMTSVSWRQRETSCPSPSTSSPSSPSSSSSPSPSSSSSPTPPAWRLQKAHLQQDWRVRGAAKSPHDHLSLSLSSQQAVYPSPPPSPEPSRELKRGCIIRLSPRAIDDKDSIVWASRPFWRVDEVTGVWSRSERALGHPALVTKVEDGIVTCLPMTTWHGEGAAKKWSAGTPTALFHRSCYVAIGRADDAPQSRYHLADREFAKQRGMPLLEYIGKDKFDKYTYVNVDQCQIESRFVTPWGRGDYQVTMESLAALEAYRVGVAASSKTLSHRHW